MSMQPPQTYFEQLNAYLHWQSQKLLELEAKVAQLQQQVEALQKQRPVTVEKIEYKFDQLKIEKLDGTLHIGISPEIGKSIEQMSVDGQDVDTDPPPPKQSDSHTRIRQQADDYLHESGRTRIAQLEQSYGLVLGESYTHIMIEDMKAQLDSRIAHYEQSYASVRASPDGAAMEADIVAKLIADIDAAIELHLQQLKQKGGPPA
ncbi:MAG: spore germination protein GerPC [Paenibacillus sp.]|nr:spore germination protein GerPC [Paenibacillus sp.]